MTATNFKRQFVNDILSGRKTQTFRPKGKRLYRVGQPLWLYTGMQTKQCELVKKTVISRVEFYLFVLPGASLKRELDLYLTVPRKYLIAPQNYSAIAMRDGFKSKEEFDRFFINQYSLKPGSSKEMVLIKWGNNE